MSELILNETPVRTSQNFQINHICLKDVIIPEKIPTFEAVTISYDKQKVTMDSKLDPYTLSYGVGEELTKRQANKTFKVNITSKEESESAFVFQFDEKNTILFDEIQLIAEENTNATVLLKYESCANTKCFHHLVLKLFAKKNANLHIIILNFMNSLSQNFMSLDYEIGEEANVKCTVIDLGGKNSITNYYSNLVGKTSRNDIQAIYLGNKDQLFDLNYIAELRGEKSNVAIEVQGALKDKSKKHFKGTIDFKRGCKKAKGNENEACMLLSDTAKSLTLPMLLCSEEDVEGNHSSSTGKVGEQELFYIMSRGFEKKEAMKLMVRARLNHILESITKDSLREEILRKIDEKLD